MAVFWRSTSYNLPDPILIDDPDMAGSAACQKFYDQSNTLQFTPNDDTVTLEVHIVHDPVRTAIYLDNIHIEVASTPKLAFYYDDKGKRIKKESYVNDETYKRLVCTGCIR